MKAFKYISVFVFAVLLVGCSGTKISKNTKDLKTSKYFRVLADADDDPIFVKLQDDLGIEPKMERYTVIIDVRDNNTAMQYVLFGDEYNPTRFSWTQLSEQVRTGLLNWTGSNKEKLD
ncbi:MAG TPA: hypothetical protein PKE39_03990 [Ignavibacteria bacterium]|nr:hypothetical protein [Ignavibacteria bacterium]HMQ98162.1 hypothetical protein [Ignavibacteria bacterium]